MEISVAMATYNGEKFIAKQISSILNQTLKPSEIIICDDGSNDSTCEIIESFFPNNTIKLFKNNINLGYIKNFEKACSLCTHSLIALADQDDIWREDKLEILTKEIGKNQLIFSDMKLIDGNDFIISESFESYQRIWYPNIYEIRLAAIFWENYLTGCSCIITKELFEKCYPFPNDFPHDYWLAICATSYNSIRHIDEKLTFYRKHTANTIGALKKQVNIREYLLKIVSTLKTSNCKKRKIILKKKYALIIKAEERFNINTKYFTIMKKYLKSLNSKGIHFSAFFIYLMNAKLFKHKGLKKISFAISRLIE